MDEDREQDVPEADPFTDDEIRELQTLAANAAHGDGMAWENYLRSFFLVAIIFLVGFMAWRPGILRLSMLLALTNPSMGDSLLWRPEPEPPPPLPEIKRTPSPEEWRLTPALSANWLARRPAAPARGAGGGNLAKRGWPRFSANPWSWTNDVVQGRKQSTRDTSVLPPQKPESSFRAGNLAAWPMETPPASPQQPGGALALAPLTTLPPAGLNPPPSTPLTFPGRPLDTNAPLSLPPLPGATQPQPQQTAAPARPLAPLPTLPQPDAQQAATAPATAPEARREEPAEIDWKNREITGTIPGAYLTIYPKLRFVGLCVPGQGYVRKYNQVGVPADLTGPKMAARDGKTPYGKYYIADRHRDADGSRLFLSWPSPDDARRIGLDASTVARIEYAWERKALPPQDTTAGGGVGLTGLRRWVDRTEGGFALEEPHMEEVFTALPDKAWVFIQE